MKYKIITTLGPASRTPGIWKKLISSGAAGFRLNTSHITVQELKEWLIELEKFRSCSFPDIDLILDLQGSKWRLGDIEPEKLHNGQELVLRYQTTSKNKNILPVPHQDFFQAASSSSREILMNDAKVKLHVDSIGEGEIKARVLSGGEISANKGITFSESNFRKETLTDKDRQVLEMSRMIGGVKFAISYVKDAAEMRRYRSQIGVNTHLTAKLERKTAVEEALEIASAADELWLCRGDFGAEMGLKKMAEISYDFSKKIGVITVPVLLAGQVLEHMVKEPAPTRSEVCCLHQSLEIGYSGFVLSDETAVGTYPVESCRTAALFLTT
jgi:pyruvate kinase